VIVCGFAPRSGLPKTPSPIPFAVSPSLGLPLQWRHGVCLASPHLNAHDTSYAGRKCRRAAVIVGPFFAAVCFAASCRRSSSSTSHGVHTSHERCTLRETNCLQSSHLERRGTWWKSLDLRGRYCYLHERWCQIGGHTRPPTTQCFELSTRAFVSSDSHRSAETWRGERVYGLSLVWTLTLRGIRANVYGNLNIRQVRKKQKVLTCDLPGIEQ
jgi:hypothetical protein